MNEQLTKYAGYYKSPDGIENFALRIRLKEQVSNEREDREEQWHSREFKWQQKLFNKSEIKYYSDIKKCFTDLERKYHDEVVNKEMDDSIFSTYTNEDYFSSAGFEMDEYQTVLEKMVSNFRITDSPNRTKEYNFEKSLSSSMSLNIIPTEEEKMFIVVDLGESVENVWIKNEIILCSLKYDKFLKTLSIFPDFTTTTPYSLKIHGQSIRTVHYFIEHCSPSISEEQAFRENELLTKISERKLTLTKELTTESFFLPPKNKLYVYAFIDILSGKSFEYDNLFVQYFIDLPEHWSCENTEHLQGVTSICHAKEGEGVVFYGHNFDVVLEYDIQSLQESKTPKSPCIYFEVISKSSWERYRTEGVAYQCLPISRPGCYIYDLSCYRFDFDGCSGKLRRYFIGDAYNYEDIRWIGFPADHCDSGTFNKLSVNTVSTGEIKFRVNILHQSQAFLKEFNEGDLQGKLIYEKLNSSSLIRSVNQVLLAFKRARRKMYEVKKHL